MQASDKRLITADWHPLASGIVVTSAADKTVKIFDVEAGGAELFELPAVHGGLLANLTWNGDGSLLATSCKDKHVRIFGTCDRNTRLFHSRTHELTHSNEWMATCRPSLQRDCWRTLLANTCTTSKAH